jgi:hypothetical protein
METETIFEVAGFMTSEGVVYFRMLVRYDPEWVDHFEFLFEIRCSESVTHEFLAIAEFGGETPNVQFGIPPTDPLEICLLACVAKESIGPIIICHDKDPDVYLNCLKTKGLREIGAATIPAVLDCFANNNGGSTVTDR